MGRGPAREDSKSPAWSLPIGNVGADLETLEIACNDRVTSDNRCILDAPGAMPVRVSSQPMRAALGMGLAAVLLAMAAAACGDSNAPAKNPTTVTVQKPGDPGNPPVPATATPAATPGHS